MEERVLLLLLDTPEFAISFFGAIKIGAVPVPVNTLLKPADYKYLLNNSRARVAIVSDSLLPLIKELPRRELRFLEKIVVVGGSDSAGNLGFRRADPREFVRPGTSTHDERRRCLLAVFVR